MKVFNSLHHAKIKELLKEEGTQTDGANVNCTQYEEIDESDLITYLRSGWRIEYKMGNGKVIVRR